MLFAVLCFLGVSWAQHVFTTRELKACKFGVAGGNGSVGEVLAGHEDQSLISQNPHEEARHGSMNPVLGSWRQQDPLGLESQQA